MSEVMQQIQNLEKEIEDQKVVADFADAIQRLDANPDFRRVIKEGFMLHEAARYVRESANPALSPENRQDALAMAQAAGHLSRFLSVSIQLGNNADHSILAAQAALEEARSEV